MRWQHRYSRLSRVVVTLEVSDLIKLAEEKTAEIMLGAFRPDYSGIEFDPSNGIVVIPFMREDDLPPDERGEE